MTYTPQIKICGITSAADAQYLNDNKIEYAGFVIFEKSKRYVSCDGAKRIFEALSPEIKKVAVVVSPDNALISDIVKSEFDIIQIHGDMPHDKIDGIEVWRAVNISDIYKIQTAGMEHGDLYDALLVDAGDYGSGHTFGWSNATEDLKLMQIIEDFRNRMILSGKRFILAGGLFAGNVAEGIRIFSPDIVDVSSGVESDTDAPHKDREKIADFADAVRACTV